MTPESMGDGWGSDSGLWERNENCGRQGSLTQTKLSTVTEGAPKAQDFGRMVAELEEMKLHRCLWESGEESVAKIKKLTASRGFRWLLFIFACGEREVFRSSGCRVNSENFRAEIGRVLGACL